MARKIIKNIVCPKCNKEVEVKAYESINVTLNEQIRKKVMDEDIFYFKCENCKKKFEVTYPFLYNDMENKLMVYFIPNENMNTVDTTQIKQKSLLKEIDKRVVSSVNELKEKVIIKDFSLDDMAMELTKFAVSRVQEKKNNKKVNSIYFCKVDRKTNKLVFAIFFASDKKPVFKEVEFEVYEKAHHITQGFAKDYIKTNNFITIDLSFAKEILDRYNQNKKKR